MSKAIKLNVAEPCHENWANMQANEQGRFCLACSKTVVDFTAMSDKQLYDYFKNYTGNTCGRMNNDQLNRDLFAEQQKNRGWFRYALSALLPALILTNKAVAQGEVKKQNVECSPKVKLLDTVVVRGVVQGRIAKPKATLQEALRGKVEAPKAPDSIVIKDDVVDRATFLQEETFITLGFVVAVEEPKKSIFHSFTKFFADSLRKKPFIVYPNPAEQGATIKTEGGAVKGDYFIRVLDANGILMQEEKVNARNQKIKFNFILSKNIIPGHYTILLIDDKRKKIGSQQLIVH